MSIRKIASLGVCILLFATVGLFADGKLELGLKAPFAVGVGALDLDTGESAAISVLIFESVPIPYAMLGGQLDVGPIYMGVAGKLYTAIIQSVIYPELYVGLDLDVVQIQLSSGGILFGTFGMGGSGAFSTDLLLTDLSASLKLADALYLGLGAVAFTGTNYKGEVVPFLAYVSFKADIEF